jgi:hypothetical protein
LSEAEKAQAAAHRQQAARKIKMASLLGEGGLLEEGRSALLEGALALGRALAVESRMPEPASTNEALIAPLSHRWGDALIPLREFLGDAAGDWKPIVERLQKI